MSATDVCAQVIDFSQIDAFKSMGTGTLHGASQPKTIISDGEKHTVFMTIWEADTDTKVYWKSPDGNLPRTAIIHATGVQAFQTAGEFKLEALGDENHSVKYGYVLLHLKKQLESRILLEIDVRQRGCPLLPRATKRASCSSIVHGGGKRAQWRIGHWPVLKVVNFEQTSP